MISVITCPRPGGVKYLYPLLDAVNRQCPHACLGFSFCDGTSEVREGWRSETCVLPGKVDPRDNKHVGWEALERAAQLDEDLLFLEDDVFPVDDSAVADAISHVVPDGCGYTSFHRSRRTTPGIHSAAGFMMSQAVKIPMRSMAHLLSWRKISSGDWEAVRGFDVALAVAGHDARWKYEQTERNYFLHVGEVSAIQNGPDGRSVSF